MFQGISSDHLPVVVYVTLNLRSQYINTLNIELGMLDEGTEKCGTFLGC
jgi:hypothetical protein